MSHDDQGVRKCHEIVRILSHNISSADPAPPAPASFLTLSHTCHCTVTIHVEISLTKVHSQDTTQYTVVQPKLETKQSGYIMCSVSTSLSLSAIMCHNIQDWLHLLDDPGY